MDKAHSLAIVWFRRDLRLKDNGALNYALRNSKELILLYIHCPEEEGPWEAGGASKWWLHNSLSKLSQDIAKKGGKLIFRKGPSLKILMEITKEFNPSLITWNRLYDPLIIKRDQKIKQELKDLGLSVESQSGSTLLEPWELQTTTKGPYQVFTPFWRALQRDYIARPPLPTPKAVVSPSIESITLESLNLLPETAWDQDFYARWTPGENSAQKKISEFLKLGIKNYKENRDYPSIDGTSNLSPHLHFGEISLHDIWFQTIESDSLVKADFEPFLRQLAWRDFAHHLLFHFPQTPDQPLKAAFKKFPWRKNAKLLNSWKKGITGFPIVDAGMRELWQTGTMHNRVRMIVGSILVKNFLINWTEGSKWFWDCLVDANLANNTLGWQWIGGCGADASPYFRIFNPVTQSEKFDPNGDYLRKWVPELKNLPNKWIHKPWEAPNDVLENAKVCLGKTYPTPVVSLKESRERALNAYYELKAKA